MPSNIAEGHARNHPKEFRQFLYLALGSLAELDTQVTIAGELGYATESDTEAMRERIVELRKMISGLLKKVNATR